MVIIFRKSKKLFQTEISFHFLIIIQCNYVEKHETLSPLEDHQWPVNLWKIGLWRHAPYISEEVLIRFPYLRCERLTISNLCFMHKVHDGLHWLPRDDLIDKFLVKSAYRCSFGIKRLRTATHWCVLMVLDPGRNVQGLLYFQYGTLVWIVKLSSLSQYFLWLWRLDPEYVVKLYLSRCRAIQENILF